MKEIDVLKLVRDWYDNRRPMNSFPIDQVKDAIAEANKEKKGYDSDAFGTSYGRKVRV